MILSLSNEYDYTIKASGNLDLPEAERVTVKIIRPSYIQHAELSTIECSVDREGDSKVKMITKVDYNKIICNHVTDIKNLSINNGSKTIEIKNGKDLIAVKGVSKELREIVDELAKLVLDDDIKDGEAKN
jgi:hypothetical protein